ncbi:hemolysin family protein [Ruminococcus sp. Marseille-P6503]|uniref:hemolysin family protein n=1 Tax=Ruminococcus sp. Marseille-P6503 TaxID=2364796 RepID=UPI001FAA7142|nr:hemolysin family protein [Ruminococcus sp. Marseille-P6503]
MKGMVGQMDDAGRLWQGFLICAVALFASGFFTACENALIEMNDMKAKKLSEEHKRGKTLKKLLDKPNRLVMLNLVSRTVMIIIMSAAATAYFFSPLRNSLLDLFSAEENKPTVYYAAGLLSFLIIICVLAAVISVLGIMLPKRLCSGGKITDRFVMNTCQLYRLFLALFVPLELLVSGITSAVLRLFGVKEASGGESVTEEEILMMVDAVNETGGLEETQAEMISNIFEFDDLEVHEIMTHRTEVVAVEDDSSVKDAVRIVIDQGFSRIPVYKGNIDDICGVVFAKDLLKAVFVDHADDRLVREFMREIKYIPESNSCKELFEFFTSQKKQIAVVVDEYGGTAGIVTMEDLLESIVGNIQDEYDDEDEEIQEITPNTFDINGKADPEEAMERLGAKLPEDSDYDTMSGFATDILGFIPSKGEAPSFTWQNIDFSVIKVSEKRIEKLRAVIRKSGPEQNAAAE